MAKRTTTNQRREVKKREAKQSQGMREQRDKALAREAIAKNEWFQYINVPNKIAVLIQRSLIPLVQEFILDNDWGDACSAIANFALPHIKNLTDAGFHFGQSEGFLKQPFVATWYVLMMDGRVYVADREFFPYPDTAFIPSQR